MQTIAYSSNIKRYTHSFKTNKYSKKYGARYKRRKLTQISSTTTK